MTKSSSCNSYISYSSFIELNQTTWKKIILIQESKPDPALINHTDLLQNTLKYNKLLTESRGKPTYWIVHHTLNEWGNTHFVSPPV